ncbi:histone-lysine N-methyltransferase SETMAR [Trichonephila clavipes]|nr:histone-lysine N-methyltransferase SETMAR [Trichonephila clavipes]
MESKKQRFLHISLLYNREAKNGVQAKKKIADVYGDDVLTLHHCQNSFAKFLSDNFKVEAAPRSGRPVEADKVTKNAFIDANRQITTLDITERLNLSNSAVYSHLKGPD